MLAEVEQAYVHALASVEGIGPGRLARLLSAYPCPKDLETASLSDLASLVGEEGAARLRRLLESGVWSRSLDAAMARLIQWRERGIMAVTLTSPFYPPLLRMIPDPPPVLYARGNLDVLRRLDAIAVVGTRQPTALGLEIARRVAGHFASLGYAIVSGLARGIDTAAHRGALAAGGVTVAVLGTPVDDVYPPENEGRVPTSGGKAAPPRVPWLTPLQQPRRLPSHSLTHHRP